MRYIIISCLLAATAFFSFLSQKALLVHGKITDSMANAIQGATVTEKGTRSSTTTDVNGEFKLSVTNSKAILVVSGLGFQQTEFAVNGKSNLHLTIPANASDSTRLDEVVVVGIDGRRRPQASVSTPVISDMKSQQQINQTLQGRVAGVMIRRESKKNRRNDFAPPTNTYGQVYEKRDEPFNTEDYDNIVDNRFLSVNENALSTFSIDVDAASYSNVRRFLQMGQMPPAGAIRTEEMINYFHYEYPQPQKSDPFSINTEIANCPWNTDHQLVLIGLQGKKIPTENLPPSNLVFLIDVSGSMMEENKLPLVQSSMKMLVDQLRSEDKVSIVVYAGNAGLVLPPTSGANKTVIKDAIDKLEAGGSTAGGAGIQLAYKVAKENFKKPGNNRVILCTDGDFNVGASSDDELVSMIENERKSGVFLTVLGYGMGNYKDNKMEKLADKGNGNHAYIDGINEARKVLVNEFGGTLFTIAKDVKLQVEFNPAKVQAYRLIGYENRLLNKEDFNNDKKDAGELGSGHTVTALYEIIPVGVKNEFEEKVDKLKYQNLHNSVAAAPNEILNIKFRYKQPDEDVSKLIEHAVMDTRQPAENASNNFRFAAAVAEFALVLRNSEFKEGASYNDAWTMAKNALGNDTEGYRSEFLQLVRNAQSIARNEGSRRTGHRETDKLAARNK